MNPNQKVPASRGPREVLNQQREPNRRSNSAVTPSAPSIRRFGGPAVNKPQALQRVAAPRTFAPPPKPLVPVRLVRQTVAPPGFRPVAMKDIQPKMANGGIARKPPQPPPVYRPEPKRIAQAKTAAPARARILSPAPKTAPPQGVIPSRTKHPIGPPVYRPQPLSKVLQQRPSLQKRSGSPNVSSTRNVRGRQGQIAQPAVLAKPASTFKSGQTIQRLVLAMGPDQQHAVGVLAQSRKGFFSTVEEYGTFDGYHDFTANDDRNITLWGHADQNTYGGRSVGQLVAALKHKGLAQSGHTVLELLGCAPNQTGEQSTETYAQLVQRSLDEDNDIKRRIRVMAYPMPEPGGESTNIRFDLIDKFVYLYGDAHEFAEANERLRVMSKVYQSNGPTAE